MKTKFNNIIMMVAVPVLAIAFPACNKNNETPTPKPPDPQEILAISIDKNTFHFGSKANETHTLSVENTTEWEVRNTASWVSAEKLPDNTLRITATPSRLLHDRATTLTVAATNPEQGEASFVVTQAHGTPRLYTRTLQGGITARHCSENGRWATGQKSTAIIVVDITKLADQSYTGTRVSLERGVHSIDNNGKPYSGGCSGDGTIYSDYDTQGAVDQGPDKEFFPNRYIPYIMRNDRKINLSYPGTYSTSTITVPGYVSRHKYQGCIPDKMSADGKHIYGRLMNTDNGWFAAKWTRIGTSNTYTFKELGLYSDGDLNKWDTVKTEHEEKNFMTITPKQFLCAQHISGLSLYGKYACGHYGSSLIGGGQLFRYDMEADKLELLEDASGIALYITDDGTLFATNDRVYKIGQTESISTHDWIVEVYGETIASQVVGSMTVGSVSADYSTTVLFSGLTDGPSYIITVEP
ncbi:MAG: BACON domain-containing protein [Prevotellaceae bacterium]|jgi:hypothetical protein|nr:BACON domain-containing protein [Prevotellaceae bacterium]